MINHQVLDEFSRESLLEKADQCVKCGLCLPYCPTYALWGVENESPRGRISLIQGLLTDQLRVTPSLETSLNHCLNCRACEAVCPAYVQYGKLIEGIKPVLAQQSHNSLSQRMVTSVAFNHILNRPQRLRLLYTMLRRLQAWGLDRSAWSRAWLKRLGLRPWLNKLPPLHRLIRWRPYYASHRRENAAQIPQNRVKNNPKVGLFLGCVASVMDQKTLADTLYLLTHLGIDVYVPPQQTCCGALYAHSGDLATARRLAALNINAFHDAGVDTVVYTASGCGAFFLDYQALQIQDRGLCFMDIHRYLWEKTSIKNKVFKPYPGVVAVHEPCTLRNVIKGSDAVYRLLSLIPQADITALPDNATCCGSAGSYMLHYPQAAAQLAAPKVQALQSQTPAAAVTANIGCALHLNAACREQGLSPPFMHTVTLLRQQWAD